MRLTRRTDLQVPRRSAFAGFRFPPEVIVLAVRWYLRFGLYRDVEELLAERGIEVDHVTIHRWVRRFSPLLADAARFGRHQAGDRWHVDETYIKVAGKWVYLYRAVDQFGQVIDVYASQRRDTEAAYAFFQHASRVTGVRPTEVITDRAPTYPRALDQLWPAAWHHTERYANNRIEADHAQLKRWLRPMRGIKTMDRSSGPRRGSRVRAEPNGHMAGHRYRRGASPSAEIAGPACQIHACAEQCTRMPWRRSAGSGAHGGGGWCRVTRRHHLRPDPTVKTWAPAPAATTAGRARHAGPGTGKPGRRCRYGWSWPLPPAGWTPHGDGSRQAPARTGAPAGN
jgi:transposase-like protein